MSAATLARRYEQLRADMLAGMALTAQRWGLHLLLTRGLAAWMCAWAAMDDAAAEVGSPPAVSASTPDVNSDDSRAMKTGESSTNSLPFIDAPAMQFAPQFQQQFTSLVVDMILQRSPMLA